jgi:hypothetical protein
MLWLVQTHRKVFCLLLIILQNQGQRQSIIDVVELRSVVYRESHWRTSIDFAGLMNRAPNFYVATNINNDRLIIRQLFYFSS